MKERGNMEDVTRKKMAKLRVPVHDRLVKNRFARKQLLTPPIQPWGVSQR